MSIFDGFAKPPCAETVGWELLDADPATGAIRVGFEGRPEWCNPASNVQGGLSGSARRSRSWKVS